MKIKRTTAFVCVLSLILLIFSYPFKVFSEPPDDKNLKGTVTVDGSSTVYPVTEAISEEFLKRYPKVRVTVGISGTGGGFKKFLRHEIDINNASRPIKESEKKLAKKNKITFIELPIGYDGISVVVNGKNSWLKSLSVSQLKEIWKPNSSVKFWSDIDPAFPHKKIKLYGPGHDSGTFDYFTEAIVGKSGASRSDYIASEDDNVLVYGIQNDLYSLGYFGFAYYMENKDSLKAVPISKGGKEAVLPSMQTISSAIYPLARPVFIYINKESLKKPAVNLFVAFYLDNVASLISDVGYVPLSNELYTAVKKRFKNRATGSMFNTAGETHKKMSLNDLLLSSK